MTQKNPASVAASKAPKIKLEVPEAPRMRPALRLAIEEIVFKGRTQRAAADIAGMNETSLGRALQKPAIAGWVEHLKAQALADIDRLRKQARAIAIREGMRLLTDAQSEQVRARMVEFFASEAAKGPLVNINLTDRSQGFEGYSYPRPGAGPDTQSDAIEAQAVDIDGQSDEVASDE